MSRTTSLIRKLQFAFIATLAELLIEAKDSFSKNGRLPRTKTHSETNLEFSARQAFGRRNGIIPASKSMMFKCNSVHLLMI